jgi:adenine/guanine/hypoxanthine permease
MFAKFFKLKELGTSYKQEIIAGITTFMTMSYIIVVNPKILEAAGMPFEASMVATILSAFFGTLIMGLIANRPFAIAPYMGENAFIAYTVVKVLGYSWQEALGAIFIAGVLFLILTLFKIRKWLVNSIPLNLRTAFTVGIGLFLTFIGLNETGIVDVGVKGAPVQIGNLSDITIFLAVIGFILMGYLMIKKVKSAILLGILTITAIGAILGLVKIPLSIISFPPSILPVFGQLDIVGAFKFSFIPIIFTIFVMLFVDTMGTLLGLSYRAGLLDKEGFLPEIEKPMLCDSLATIFASFAGTTVSGVYIESASGIEAGGKTGLTSVVTAIMFLFALFFAPLLNVVPVYAYGPALIIVGMLMLSAVTKLQIDDFTELIPVFCTIILISFTYNIGIGISAGFIIYPLIKSLSGKSKEIPVGMWVLAMISLLFFILYPYK